ncbi:hypothetical protein Tco_1100696 [Tanacetum coccineum]
MFNYDSGLSPHDLGTLETKWPLLQYLGLHQVVKGVVAITLKCMRSQVPLGANNLKWPCQPPEKGRALRGLSLCGDGLKPRGLVGQMSPSKLLEKNCSSNTSSKLARAKLDKYSEDAGMSKDMLGPEKLGELQRRWYFKGHVRSGVISSVLAQRIRRSKLQRSPTDLDIHQC